MKMYGFLKSMHIEKQLLKIRTSETNYSSIGTTLTMLP